MDIATIVGIALGFMIIVGSIIKGGGAMMFKDVENFNAFVGMEIDDSAFHRNDKRVVVGITASTEDGETGDTFGIVQTVYLKPFNVDENDLVDLAGAKVLFRDHGWSAYGD